MLGLMQNWPLTVDKIIDHAHPAGFHTSLGDLAGICKAEVHQQVQ